MSLENRDYEQKIANAGTAASAENLSSSDNIEIQAGAGKTTTIKTHTGVEALKVTDSGETIISEKATLAKGLAVGGNTELKGDVALGSSSGDTVTIKGGITAKENAHFEKDVEIDGETKLNGNVTIGDSTTDTIEIKGIISLSSLNVTGNTVLGGSATNTVTVNATPTFKENSTFEKDLSIQGVLNSEDLTVKGNTVLGDSATDTITLTGLTTAKEKLTAKKDLEVQGNTVLGDSATDTTKIKGALTAYEDVTLNESLSVLGNATIGDALTDNTWIKGALTGYGDAMLEKSLIVKGDTTLGTSYTNTIQIKGESKVKEKMQVEKDLWFGTNSKVRFSPIADDKLYLYLGGYRHSFVDTRVPSADVSLGRFVCGVGHYDKSFAPLDTSYIEVASLFGLDVTDKFDEVRLIVDIQGEMCFLSVYIRVKGFSVTIPSDAEGVIRLSLLEMLKTFTPISEIGDSYFTAGVMLSAYQKDTATSAMHGSTSQTNENMNIIIYESPYTNTQFDATACFVRANAIFRIKRTQ
jgi:predicted acyltransferase (DUF342 family)